MLSPKTNWASPTAFRTFILDPGSPSIGGVCFHVTRGTPAFSDRSGVNLAVNSRMGCQHSAKVAKLERSLPGALRKLNRKSGIIEESR